MPAGILRPSPVDPIVTQIPPPVVAGSPISVDGAYIEEAINSDAGNVITLDRKDVVKRYIVRVPTIHDKPVRYLRTAFPIGLLYPGREEDYSGLVVYGYDEGERINESDTAWHASVIYSAPDRLATLSWVTEGEFSDEQEHIIYDVPPDPSDPLGGLPRLIGPAVYEPAGAGESTHTAPDAHGDIIQLKQTSAVRVTGADRYRGVHRFSMIRTLFSLTWNQIRLAGSRVGKVNSDTFLTYEPGELLLLNFGWREVYGMFPNTQSSTNKNFEVRLLFGASVDPKWSPIYRPDDYQDARGFSSVVSPRVIREFFPYRAISFYGIFSALNTGAPPVT